MVPLPFQRVMLVDDDAFILDMYRTKFTSEGAEVACYTSTRKALRALQEHREQPDVALVDMVMPEMDGVAFVRAVRALPEGDRIVLIMLTNQGQDTDRQAAEEAGVDGFLVKANLTPSQVVTSVCEIVREKKAGTA